MGCLSSSESEERPGVGIGIKVLSKDNKLLVGKREKEGLYGYPGGHLEKYESWEECAARELKEETGIEVQSTDIKYIATYNVIDKEDKYHYIEIDVGVLMPEDQTPEAKEPKKCKEWIWVSPKDMEKDMDKYFYPIQENFKNNKEWFENDFQKLREKLEEK